VVAGDTLLDIAQRFSVVEQQLIDLNQITDPNVIYAGEVLQLPPP
jgi:LysM repeat protein